MIIGVPKEIKMDEYRVGLTPEGVLELTQEGHSVLIESQCGEGIGYTNEAYIQAGAEVVSQVDDLYERSEMIVKVKEPQPIECQRLRPKQLLFTYLHLAADPMQAKGLIESGVTAIAYETVTDAHGALPLLIPMSEVAGRLSVQAGARALQKHCGGRGMLLGGVPGVKPAEVVIIGGGVVGTNALKISAGMGANVTVLDRSSERLRALDDLFRGNINTVFATSQAIKNACKYADLVIGAVLIPGAAAPRLLTKQDVQQMKKGSVIVDVSIDQGGCFETSRATTHGEPCYMVHDVVHYCVANMPGAVPLTSTKALTHATLPYVKRLAHQGLQGCLEDPHFRNGINVYDGSLVHPIVARDLGMECNGELL